VRQIIQFVPFCGSTGIGYYPSKPGQNGERREIKVKVTEADLVVKARDSYIYSDKGRRLTQMLTRMNP
jgi:hypothetical protein